MKPYSKRGLNFSLFYFGVYLLSGIYAVLVLSSSKNVSPEFSPASLVVLPWTFIIVPIKESTGIGIWIDHFQNKSVLYGILITLVYLPGAVLNGIIFYFIGKHTERL